MSQKVSDWIAIIVIMLSIVALLLTEAKNSTAKETENVQFSTGVDWEPIFDVEIGTIEKAPEIHSVRYTFEYPEYYWYCQKWGEIYNISPEFLYALIEKESSFDKTAENGDCLGLCQVSLTWHKDRMERLGVTDLFDPESNIMVCADYLAELFSIAEEKGYGDDPYYVLMRYNMKTETAEELYAAGEYSDYAIDICTNAAAIERAVGK